MPRPLLKPLATQTQTNTILSATMHSEQKQQTTQEQKMKIDRLLRQKRSKRYMEALAALDAGGHVMNRAQVERILDAIRNEFPEVELQGILLGYVSKCCLGKPYEVHTLDPNNQIIEHYKMGHPLPNGMEKARGIAIRGGYSFIEVYVDCCRAVSGDGSVSVIPM